MATERQKHEGLIEGPFLFIVNPKSGTGAYRQFQERIAQVDHERSFEVVESQSPEHSIELAATAGQKGYRAVIAVGGDGSVHEIGTKLIGTETALGIIPTGSGNGIARHLGISLPPAQAIKEMLGGKCRAMDTLMVNDRAVIGFCGIGFDGHVARLFSEAGERGFSNYVKLTLDAISNYRSTDFEVTADDQVENSEALTVVCANITQFGNNAAINPQAIDNDGCLEVITVKPFPVASFPTLAARLFINTFHKSKFVNVRKASQIRIENKGEAEVQIDGEPFGKPDVLNIRVKPKSLKVIIP